MTKIKITAEDVKAVNEFIHEYSHKVYNMGYICGQTGLTIQCETEEGSTLIKIYFPFLNTDQEDYVLQKQEDYILEITGIYGTKKKVAFDHIEDAIYVVKNYIALQALDAGKTKGE